VTPEKPGAPDAGTLRVGAEARAAEEFRKLRGVDPFGPFIPLLKSPELMPRVAALGEYLRHRSALPPRLRELAIVITAAHWRQAFEWDIHAPLAHQAGVPRDVLEALWNGETPFGLEPDQQALYDLCNALHRDRQPAAKTVEHASSFLGEQGLIDAICICGYYALLAMVLNTEATRGHQ
jgi:4-carboxymuconolactone decarboxylase